jgi:hypothetical protein
MKIKKIIFPLFVILLFASCIDEIQLDIDNDKQVLTVDGLIADSLQEYTIKVNLSAIIGVSTDDLKTPVTGASVLVKDDLGGSYLFEEAKPGTYNRYMQGEVGRTYHVEITTTDGKTVKSNPTLLRKAPPILPATPRLYQVSSVSNSGNNVYEDRLELGMNVDVSAWPERPFLRWRATGEYELGEDYPGIIDRKNCYVKGNIDFNNIAVFNTEVLDDGRLTQEPFVNMKYDYRFFSMYCFHLLQYAISEEEYRYWQNVRAIVNIDGSLFDPPPGTVKGNLYNPEDPNDEILGYFSVAGQTYYPYFINATELNVPVKPHCGIRWPPVYPDECYDCLTLQNSTAARPSYWKP